MGGREFSPIIDEEANEDTAEMLFAKKRFCFCIPYSSHSHSHNSSSGFRRIWSSGLNSLMKIREWSEMAAGPKWKTFIRRFNRSRSSKYQYDPLSYAQNFDEGPMHNAEADDYLSRNFSSRYATLPASAKGSMDLGKEGPSFS